MEHPTRKPNRLSDFSYSTEYGYFITICTINRANLFWSIVGADSIRPSVSHHLTHAGRIVQSAIEDISIFYPTCRVDQYCIMPNHVHLILLPATSDSGRILSAPTISTVIGQMKRTVSRTLGHPVWQKSFHDHVIRGEQDYREIWQYIDENPQKWELDCFYAPAS